MIRLSLVALFLSLLWVPSAQAEPLGPEPQLVGILSIETKGVSEAAAEQFEAEVEESLGGVGMQSVGRAALREKLEGTDFIDGCLFGPCLATLRGATGVPIVLVANIQGIGSSYNFVITLIDTKTGIPTSQVSQNCAVCTIEEAISTATLTTISVLTGTGDAESSAAMDSSRVLGPQKAEPEAKAGLRRTGLIFLGVGVVGVVAGAILHVEKHREAGLVGLASGAGLATGGASMLLLSRHF